MNDYRELTRGYEVTKRKRFTYTIQTRPVDPDETGYWVSVPAYEPRISRIARMEEESKRLAQW